MTDAETAAMEVAMEEVFIDKNPLKQAPEKPEPPILTNLTHHSVDCQWKHVRDKLPKNQKFKFILQGSSQNRNKGEWNLLYNGFGVTKNVGGLEPSTEFFFRLIVVSPKKVESEPSERVSITTEKEPLSGDVLHKAIQKERIREVEEILDSDQSLRIIEIPDKYDHLPLMIAVLKSNVELVELIILKGAHVNAQNESGKTALMLAAFYGRINIIKELRNNGGSYKIKDKSGGSVLHYAVDGGNLDAIQFLLMDGHEVDPVDKGGWTPLIRLASMNGSRDAADVLIKYNCDIDVVDVDKKNALIIAVLNGNLPLVQCLVESGSDLKITNEYGKTAYEIAVALEKNRVIKFFEEHFDKNGISYI